MKSVKCLPGSLARAQSTVNALRFYRPGFTRADPTVRFRLSSFPIKRAGRRAGCTSEGQAEAKRLQALSSSLAGSVPLRSLGIKVFALKTLTRFN